jgi:hypothetical protein
LGDLDRCIDLLLQTNRIPEAAFFARTYKPSHVSRIVKLWKQSLVEKRPLLAEALVDPQEYPDMFPEFDVALERERDALESLREQISSLQTESSARSKSVSPNRVNEGIAKALENHLGNEEPALSHAKALENHLGNEEPALSHPVSSSSASSSPVRATVEVSESKSGPSSHHSSPSRLVAPPSSSQASSTRESPSKIMEVEPVPSKADILESEVVAEAQEGVQEVEDADVDFDGF